MSAAAHAGRIMLGGFFVLAGINKIADPAGPVALMEEQGFPVPELVVWAVVALEITGGALVVWGRSRVVPAAAALAAFALATNLGFHRFWEVADPGLHRLELSLFFKNLAIVGGLLVVAGSAVGRRARD